MTLYITTYFAVLGFQNVQTFILSGNVFVDEEEQNPDAVGYKMKQKIFKAFGREVPAVVLGKADLEDCLKSNSFLKEKDFDIKKLYAAFISTTLRSNRINDLKISKVKPDEANIEGGSRSYIKYAVGAGKTRFDQKYSEKKFNVTATIRNILVQLLR